MAAPTLQAQGATSAVTSGAPAVTIPTHQADDIIVVAAAYWGPATAGDAAQIPTPTNYILLGTQVGQPAGTRDGWLAWFWRRAPGAASTVTLTTGASWDSGTDTCYGARAYVIRGCITSGDPFDQAATSGPHTSADQAFPAVTVSGAERMVVQFGNSQDNAAFAMTSSGWTDGTEDDDPAGTDCAFQTTRKDNVSASTSADASTCAAPAQGAYAFLGVSFKPPVTAAEFAAAVSGTGAVAAALTTEITMVAGVSGTGSVAGALTTEITMAAAASGVASVAADLNTSITLAASLNGVATVTADLTAAPQAALFEASVSGTGTIVGVLTTEINMAASVSGTGSVAGALTTEITMAASVSGIAMVLADLTAGAGGGGAPLSHKVRIKVVRGLGIGI